MLLIRGAPAALLCAILLILLASPWIDRPGMQTDEVIFSGGIYPPFHHPNTVEIGGKTFPLMVMSYVGTLKSWLYRPVMARFGTTPRTVRYTGILISAVTVAGFCLLMVAATGSRAAMLAGLVLATDPVWVLYSRWDHGPVVTLHLLLVGTLAAGVGFARTRRPGWLALACLLMGLALWEKAVFVWLMSGLVLAVPLTFGVRPVREWLKPRWIALAVAAFLVGSLPLVVYNAKNRFVTFRSNTKLDAREIPAKIQLLRSTFQGDALFGSMIREPWDGPSIPPPSPMGRLVTALAEVTGDRRTGFLLYLFGASCVVALISGDALARFVLIAGALAWLQMLVTRGAGGAAHHTILLWPLPFVVIGVAAARLWEKGTVGRVVIGGAVLTCCVANVLVLSTYYSCLLRNGGTDTWTEAMSAAIADVGSMNKGAVGVVDWGFLDTVRLNERGRTLVFGVEDPAAGGDSTELARKLTFPGAVFLTHTEGHESFPGITRRVLAAAEGMGLVPVEVKRYADHQGRLTVETFRLAPRR